MFSKAKVQEMMAKFANVNVADIQDASLRAQAVELKKKQSGFTLLELLVVVAILAAIAGTATISLQDTDARAAAAAHVAMMDELNKGVRTFRVLQKNVLPNNLDSLLYAADTSAAAPVATTLLPNADGEILGIGDVAAGALITGVDGIMGDIGMTELRVINEATADFADGSVVTADCANTALQATISSRGNAVVAGNIFNGEAGNGCGASVAVADMASVAYWSGSVERILGASDWGDATFDGSVMTSTSGVAADVTAPIFLAVGMGPASNLFDASQLGGMTSVPVYRHVAADQYNRFIGLFHVANATTNAIDTWDAPVAHDQVAFVGTVDGAGDTKEEELGEWDGTRNTI